jgi:predicted ATP-grasp superfamily ATP-dependent carboligase
MRALILEDGYSRQALTASRALAAAGWTVGVGAHRARGVAACSRATTYDHRVPAPERDLARFVEGVNEAISEVGYDLVFGARDVEVLALSARRSEIHATVPHPPHANVLRALDKLELDAAAQDAGVATPATVPGTAEALAGTTYPVVVKARLHATLDGIARPARIETLRAMTQLEATKRADAIRAVGGEPLLQEAVAGPLLELALVVDRDGEVVACVQQVVARTSTRDGGVGVRATTVMPDEGLLQRVRTLFAELGWWGLAELQFIVSPEGDPHLIDFNGRFYGSMALAVGAGVNLPAIWASVATGRPTAGTASAETGVRFQWLAGDVRRCFAEEGAERLRTLRQTGRWSVGAIQSVLAVRDPLPAIRHATLDARSFIEKRVGTGRD